MRLNGAARRNGNEKGLYPQRTIHVWRGRGALFLPCSLLRVRALCDARAPDVDHHPHRCRTRLRAAAAARPRGDDGHGRRADRPDWPQWNREVDPAEGNRGRAAARFRGDPSNRRPADCDRGAGAGPATRGIAARKPRCTRALRADRGRPREMACRGPAGRVPAPLRTGRILASRGGVRRRMQACALALAFALEPQLLLLDEPTNHLDIDGIALLEGLLRKGAGRDLRHARPRFPRPRRHAHRRARPRAAALLPGNFSAYERRKADQLAAEAVANRKLRQVLGAGRGLDPQGRRGAAHAQRRAGAPPRGRCARSARRGASASER
jgi:hypothetical protein